jgi:hypothetical protein
MLNSEIITGKEVIFMTLTGQASSNNSESEDKEDKEEDKEAKKEITIGSCWFDLKWVEDQRKHVKWVNLEMHKEVMGRMNVEVQWVFSRVRFLTQIINKWGANIHGLFLRLQKYENTLMKLRGIQNILTYYTH